MTTWLRVKNWEEFQHYRDRLPPWIKLHRSMLEDYQFAQLPDAAKAHLMSIWCLAASDGGQIPNDPEFIANRINATEPVDLKALIKAGMLIPSERQEWTSPWPTRQIAPALRDEILGRDKKCRKCGTRQSLEIDHIIPVSKGGESTSANLQVLCRSCNRKKRASVEQRAPHTRSPETETETEKRQNTETDKSDFEKTWKIYPRKEGKTAAMRQWLARRKEGHLAETMHLGTQRYNAHCIREQKETKYIKLGATFFGRDRHWESDYSAQKPVGPTNGGPPTQKYVPPQRTATGPLTPLSELIPKLGIVRES